MKQVTLKFREVAVDGFPKKSGYCAVVYRSSVDQELEPDMLPFSVKHQAFNTHDSFDDTHTRIDNVAFWMMLDEFNAAFEGGETP